MTANTKYHFELAQRDVKLMFLTNCLFIASSNVGGFDVIGDFVVFVHTYLFTSNPCLCFGEAAAPTMVSGLPVSPIVLNDSALEHGGTLYVVTAPYVTKQEAFE